MQVIQNLKGIFKRNTVIFQNLTYITFLQIFLLLTPLITYPYLVRVLGKELYGLVIIAQIVASYCSIIVDFGFKSVSARHISIFRDDKSKLSEVLCAVLSTRFLLWCVCLVVYLGVVFLIPSYREHYLLFAFSFGITFNELLFPQFFFQGIEKMKYISLLNIGIRLLFVVFIFCFVTQKEDYILVPLFTSIGFLGGGIASLYVVFVKEKIKWVNPTIESIKKYTKDAAPIFATDFICSIKDKLNYILLGSIVGIENVVVYDLGAKFNSTLVKPIGILGTVLFPKIAKERNIKLFKKMAFLSFFVISFFVIIMNIFLPQIAHFFLGNSEVDLFPLRLFLFAPIILSLSGYIASNLMIALGYNKYILYSILVTTVVYVFAVLGMYTTGYLNSVSAFVMITVISYLAELVYRLYASFKIIKNENQREVNSSL